MKHELHKNIIAPFLTMVAELSLNPRTSERRLHSRKQLWFPCIHLGAANGGIILDISESGLAMQAVRNLADGQLPAMRFQLSESLPWIETRGRIAWISASNTTAGVEFVGLPEEARNQIRQWIPSKLHPSGSAKENPFGEKSEPVIDLLPTGEPESAIVVTESEATGCVDEYQDRHSLVKNPTKVLRSTAETQDPERVSLHIEDNSTKLAVTENARYDTNPALDLSYQETTFSPETSGRGRTTGSRKPGQRTRLFLTLGLLVSACFFLAYRFQRIGNGSHGTEVIAAPRLPELPSDKSANPKILPVDPNSPLDHTGFVLQVGAMTHKENADALAESLRQKNFPVIVFRSGTGRFYQVAVGPYSELDSTLRVKEQLRKQGCDSFRTPWSPSAQ